MPDLQLSHSQQTPNALCLLRLSSIGDVCHAVSMVQAIQRHWPACHISWIVGHVEASLLDGLPGVELITFDKRNGWSEFRRLRQQLKGRRFDALLHMQVALRASLASLSVPATRRIGFDRDRAGEGQWLFTNQKVAAQSQPHVLEGFQAFANALGVPDYQPHWNIPISDSDTRWATEQVPAHQKTLVICAAASKPERNWTVAGYAALADYAHQRGLQVVLCGGPSPLERQLAEAIADVTNSPVTNLVGHTSLKQLLALLKRACVVLAPDTGPAHMAVTVNTPVLGLYAHSNPRRTGPYLFQHYVINHYDRNVEAQFGKPWHQLPWGTRAKGDHLMAQISVDEVIAMFDGILEREICIIDHCGSSCHPPVIRPQQLNDHDHDLHP